jgi:hypothetical protein
MAAMVRPGRRFEPDASRAAAYREGYARARALAAHLAGDGSPI